jgi:hypothetical protein
MATEPKKYGKIRKIRVQNETIYVSLPGELFGPLVGRPFRQTVKPTQEGGFIIELAPVKK